MISRKNDNNSRKTELTQEERNPLKNIVYLTRINSRNTDNTLEKRNKTKNNNRAINTRNSKLQKKAKDENSRKKEWNSMRDQRIEITEKNQN